MTQCICDVGETMPVK